jgi:hypothetical protein
MPKEEEVSNKEFKDKQTLISKVGTKLANLIFFLKKNDTHTIIFSQWDDLLKNVGEVLNDYGIKNVFCKGHVWQRDKAIRDFQENNDIKVIMLSSESAASGTNLTKADTVIFLDPVYGTSEYRKNTERQATGRAHRMGQTKQVKVVRFIIKNTVEHEIYDLNIIEDKKLNINIKPDFQTHGNDINLNKEQIDEIAKNAIEIKKNKLNKPNKKDDNDKTTKTESTKTPSKTPSKTQSKTAKKRVVSSETYDSETDNSDSDHSVSSDSVSSENSYDDYKYNNKKTKSISGVKL